MTEKEILVNLVPQLIDVWQVKVECDLLPCLNMQKVYQNYKADVTMEKMCPHCEEEEDFSGCSKEPFRLHCRLLCL